MFCPFSGVFLSALSSQGNRTIVEKLVAEGYSVSLLLFPTVFAWHWTWEPRIYYLLSLCNNQNDLTSIVISQQFMIHTYTLLQTKMQFTLQGSLSKK